MQHQDHLVFYSNSAFIHSYTSEKSPSTSKTHPLGNHIVLPDSASIPSYTTEISSSTSRSLTNYRDHTLVVPSPSPSPSQRYNCEERLLFDQQICDGVKDCDNGLDENECISPSTSISNCHVHKHLMCDGVTNCLD